MRKKNTNYFQQKFKRKAAEILTDSNRYINVLKFRCCKVNHFRGDTQMKKPPMRHAPRANEFF